MILRQSALELVERAARLGVDAPWRLLDMTAREMEWFFRAEAARRQREAEQADLAAWLTGRYVLAALHAPRRFPRRPDGVLRRPPSMSDDDMKQVFLNFAAQRRERHGGG